MARIKGLVSAILGRSSTATFTIIPITLLTNLALLALLQSQYRQASAAVQVQPSQAGLTCRQVFRIGTWSETRYANPKGVNFTSKEFAKKLMRRYVTRMDPMRILYTQGDVNALVQNAEPAWQKARGGDCSSYEKLHKDLTRKIEIHRKRVAQIKIAKVETEEAPSTDANEAFQLFKNFAKDEKEIGQRLEKLASMILVRTEKPVLAAYRNDTRKLIGDSFEEVMMDEEPATNLLAKAMLSAIDPYSTYLDAQQFEEFYQDLIGATSGIGVRVRKAPHGILVEKLLKGTPAARSKKISVGDTIVAVDGKSLEKLSTREAKRLLRGREDTLVSLEILKQGSKKNTMVKLKRESFAYEESRITKKMISPEGLKRPVAVISIPSFYGRGGIDTSAEERSSAEDLERIVSELTTAKKKPSAIVLDLRGNPGGFLEEAVSMAGLFIGDRAVVGVVEPTGKRVLRDTREALYDGPLVVLLDQGSASAAEVLAGALKDHQRALVLGDGPSYGKGTVQRLFHLRDELMLLGQEASSWDGVVKLTTSVFYSPLGHTPANGGVVPHIVLSTAAMKRDKSTDIDEDLKVNLPETDPFLDSADLELLNHTKPQFSTKLAQLEKHHQARLRERSESEEESEEDVLEEAASITVDYTSAMEERTTPRVTKVNAENPQVRNVPGPVVGY